MRPNGPQPNSASHSKAPAPDTGVALEVLRLEGSARALGPDMGTARLVLMAAMGLATTSQGFFPKITNAHLVSLK